MATHLSPFMLSFYSSSYMTCVLILLRGLGKSIKQFLEEGYGDLISSAKFNLLGVQAAQDESMLFFRKVIQSKSPDDFFIKELLACSIK